MDAAAGSFNNATTRMPIEIFLVMLIGAIVFPFALWIRFLRENEKKKKTKTHKVFW